MPYVLSTMTNSVKYTKYDTRTEVPVALASVFIHGGANVPSDTSGVGHMTKDAGKPIWTASGMITSVTDAELELLRDVPLFKSHEEKNLVQVLNANIIGNNKAIDKITNGMATDDFGLLDHSKVAGKLKAQVQHPDQKHRL